MQASSAQEAQQRFLESTPPPSFTPHLSLKQDAARSGHRREQARLPTFGPVSVRPGHKNNAVFAPWLEEDHSLTSGPS